MAMAGGGLTAAPLPAQVATLRRPHHLFKSSEFQDSERVTD
jgi:hypothetical protein